MDQDLKDIGGDFLSSCVGSRMFTFLENHRNLDHVETIDNSREVILEFFTDIGSPEIALFPEVGQIVVDTGEKLITIGGRRMFFNEITQKCPFEAVGKASMNSMQGFTFFRTGGAIK